MGEGTFSLGMADRAMRLTEREQDAAAGQVRVRSVRHRENCDLTRQVFSCCPPFFPAGKSGFPAGKWRFAARKVHTEQDSRVQHSTVEYSTAEYSTVQQNRKKSAIPRREQRTFFLVCGCCGQIELMSIISQFSILMSPSRQRSSAETVSIEVRHGIARSTAVRRICTEPSSG